MEPTIPPGVARAFARWCAVMDLPSAGTGAAGSFRLARDGEGSLRIEQQPPDGGAAQAVTPPLPDTGFCAAVDFLTASFRLKTQLVARMVARRRSRKPGGG